MISSLPGSALRTHVDIARQASRCQHAFSKPCLVNLISKDTHLVFSISLTGGATIGHVDVYFTSTNPNATRYFFITPTEYTCLIVAAYYFNPNRVDVFIDDGKTNAKPKNWNASQGGYEYDPTKNYIPTCNDEAGANYIDRGARMVYFVLKGDQMIWLVKAQVVLVTFDLFMTPEQFYKENVIQNLAYILNIPEDRIRIVKAVRASGNRKRRKRSVGMNLEIEIGDLQAESKYITPS